MVLWFLSHLFMQSFNAADEALTATFNALEAAAIVSEETLRNR